VRVEPGRLVVRPYGVHGRLRWSDLAASPAPRPLAQTPVRRMAHGGAADTDGPQMTDRPEAQMKLGPADGPCASGARPSAGVICVVAASGSPCGPRCLRSAARSVTAGPPQSGPTPSVCGCSLRGRALLYDRPVDLGRRVRAGPAHGPGQSRIRLVDAGRGALVPDERAPHPGPRHGIAYRDRQGPVSVGVGNWRALDPLHQRLCARGVAVTPCRPQGALGAAGADARRGPHQRGPRLHLAGRQPHQRRGASGSSGGPWYGSTSRTPTRSCSSARGCSPRAWRTFRRPIVPRSSRWPSGSWCRSWATSPTSPTCGPSAASTPRRSPSRSRACVSPGVSTATGGPASSSRATWW
jgi:hypothetical protein